MTREERAGSPRSGLDWGRDGLHWPNRDATRFVEAGGLRWHVQVMGSGPVALLLHGTGAATHSWRDFAPLLAQSFTVVAPDLPGHGFTGTPPARGMSLPGMASGVAQLLQTLGKAPVIAVGHSAGAAVAAQMSLSGTPFAALVSLNGAFVPIGGSRVFSPLAKLFASTSLVPRLFAWRAGERGTVDGLLRRTGSHIDDTGKALYARLARNPVHVAGALTMMANWDLHALRRRLPRLDVPLLLVAGGNDGTIPSTDAFATRDLVPGAQVEYIRGVGHLAHEERPQELAEVVMGFARMHVSAG